MVRPESHQEVVVFNFRDDQERNLTEIAQVQLDSYYKCMEEHLTEVTLLIFAVERAVGLP